MREIDMAEIHPKVASVITEDKFLTVRVWEHANFDTPISSPRDFAAALNYDARRIAKTVLLANRSMPANKRLAAPEGQYAAACLPAPSRMDLGRIAILFGWSRSEMAKPDELSLLLDYPPGGVSPLGLGDIPLIIDNALFAFDTILVGAGRTGVEIEIRPDALLTIPSARMAELSQPL